MHTEAFLTVYVTTAWHNHKTTLDVVQVHGVYYKLATLSCALFSGDLPAEGGRRKGCCFSASDRFLAGATAGRCNPASFAEKSVFRGGVTRRLWFNALEQRVGGGSVERSSSGRQQQNVWWPTQMLQLPDLRETPTDCVLALCGTKLVSSPLGQQGATDLQHTRNWSRRPIFNTLRYNSQCIAQLTSIGRCKKD